MDKKKEEYAATLEWNAQGKNSFVKAKEAFAIDRLLLDFVEHSGKPECKMKNAIPIYIPMIKAGSDTQKEYGGTGETGQSALGLAKLIVSDRLARRAEISRKKATEAGSKYPEDIWGCVGGTTATRSKDGKAVFRRISIAPSSTEGSYVLKAEMCEGEESSSGGVMPKKGAERTRIMVRVDGLYMDALGEFILTEWTAYRTAKIMSEDAGQTEEPSTKEEKKVPENQKKDNSPVYMVYDKSIYGFLGSAIGSDEAVQVITEAIVKLRDEQSLIANEEDKKRLKKEVLKPGANGWLPQVRFSKKGSDKEEDVLFVMVDKRE